MRHLVTGLYTVLAAMRLLHGTKKSMMTTSKFRWWRLSQRDITFQRGHLMTIDKLAIELIPGGMMPEAVAERQSVYTLFARLDKPLTLYPSSLFVVPLGFKLWLHPDFKGELHLRPDLIKRGVRINSIPSNKKGEPVFEATLVLSCSKEADGLVIQPNERIACLLFSKQVDVELCLMNNNESEESNAELR
jgi:dUTPase